MNEACFVVCIDLAVVNMFNALPSCAICIPGDGEQRFMKRKMSQPQFIIFCRVEFALIQTSKLEMGSVTSYMPLLPL